MGCSEAVINFSPTRKRIGIPGDGASHFADLVSPSTISERVGNAEFHIGTAMRGSKPGKQQGLAGCQGLL